MHPEPFHTRGRIAPSGKVHIGHAALLWLSHNAARVTGGTFTTRIQHLWATRSADVFKAFQKYANENLDELAEIGLEGSQAQAFLAHGMSPSWRREITDDRGLADYYWHELGFDELWGTWPADPACVHALGENLTVDEASWHLDGGGESNTSNIAISPKHPFLSFVQLVGEVTTGRNCIIRGTDHLPEAAWGHYVMHLIAKKHYGLPGLDRTCRYAPHQYFMPKIVRSSGQPLSSSSSEVTQGFFVRDVLNAEVPPEKLFQYLGKVLFGSVERSKCVHTDWSLQVRAKPEGLREFYQAGAECVMGKLLPYPVIDDEDWFRFLRTKEVEP